MKKLFVVIFALTLSTNGFAWGTLTCDQFLDQRKTNNKEANESMLIVAENSYEFLILGMITMGGLVRIEEDKKEFFFSLIKNPPVTNNQILYLIEKECRMKPTSFVMDIAGTEITEIILRELKKIM